jgi:Glycosyltransferase Family 4
VRIVLVHPNYAGPAVERVVCELAGDLAERGHAVTLLSGRPAARECDGVRRIRLRRPSTALLERRSYEAELAAVPAMAWALLREPFEIAHAFSHLAAWTAGRVRGLGGPPVLFTLPWAPTRQWLLAARWRLAIVREAAERSAAVTVLSQDDAERFERYLLRRPEVVPDGAAARYEVLYERVYHRPG